MSCTQEQLKMLLRPLADQFSGDDREGLSGFNCRVLISIAHVWWERVGRAAPLQTRSDAGKGEMGSKCRNGVSATRSHPTERLCKLFPRWQSLAPGSEPQTVGDQPLPRARLPVPRELQASPQPNQGVIRGNLSPSPELSPLAQCSGLFPCLHGL